MLALLVLLPFLGTLLFIFAPKDKLPARTPHFLAVAIAGVCCAVLASLTFGVASDGPITFYREWVPSIGLAVSLWLDGPALFFAWLVLGLGFLIFLYAAFYLDPDDSPWRFFGTMVFFMGAMLGVVTSRNVVLMLVFWELTSISSFILIGHWHEKASARAGAARALVVTGAGGLALIAGIAGLGYLMKDTAIGAESLSKALQWDVLWAHREHLTQQGWQSMAVLVLLLMGAFTKSAQFPFHFWLPGAMEAPTPVSAFLHAATMVKAGIYLLGRMYPVYYEVPAWLWIVGTVGVLTMCVGGFMAILSVDLKQLLAHSTVSQLGLLTAFYGFGYHAVGTEHPLKLDLLLVASHAFFKGALFMLVGVIDHAVHTREWTRLGGLRKTMPVTWILMTIGAASMAGIPVTLGFIAKELFLKAAIHLHTENPLLLYGLPALAIFASLFTMAYCLRLAVSPFWGEPRDPKLHPHEGGLGLLFSPGLLIVLCLLGAFPMFVEKPISKLVLEDYFDTKSGFAFAMFHVDVLLAVGLFLFAGGTGVFLAAGRIETAYKRAGSPAPCAGSYAWFFDKFLPRFCKKLAKLVQPQQLSTQAFATFAALTVLFWGALIASGWRPGPDAPWDYLQLPAIFVVLITAASLWVVVTHKVLLVRLVAMSPVGLLVVLFFLFFKAPDLALTMILVEIAVLIVLLLLLFRFPQRLTATHAAGSTAMRAGVALAAGAFMGVLAYTGMTSPWKEMRVLENAPPVHEYYLQNSKYSFHSYGPADEILGYPGADEKHSGGGTNVVNVILVDYRGIDTLGEIAVLGLAAMGVVMLLKLNRRGRSRGPATEEQRSEVSHLVEDSIDPHIRAEGQVVRTKMWDSPSLILSEIGRIAPGFFIVIAIVLFLIGHNQPGGGFIAGLLASVALVLYFMFFRREDVEHLHKRDYVMLIPAGLLIAILTGIVPMVFAEPFLRSAHTYVDLPILGETELASAVAFDLGVFLTVVGTTVAIIGTFGRSKEP